MLYRKDDSDPGRQSGTSTMRRKSEHLRIVAEKNVTHSRSTLLENVRLIHQALPELNVRDIDLSASFFGKTLAAPLMITSMTGGSEFAERMNHGLAEAAERSGIAFAVGSQRVMIRHPETTGHFRVRNHIPNGVLLGNIGAVQLEEYPIDVVTGLMESIEADGICVHLNTAQELVQSEGHREFRGILDRIARLNDALDGKVLVKETGTGISPDTLKSLDSIGIKYIDISGSGGTSWTKVEMHRADEKLLKGIGETFADWGVPTAFSTIAASKTCAKDCCIIASGGLSSGLDVAKVIALGADIGGVARTVLLHFLNGGVDSACEYIGRVKEELRIAMLLTGSINRERLKRASRVYTGELREWLESFGWKEEKESRK